MCGRLYYMAGCYLYLSAQRLQQSVVGSSEADSVVSVYVILYIHQTWKNNNYVQKLNHAVEVISWYCLTAVSSVHIYFTHVKYK